MFSSKKGIRIVLFIAADLLLAFSALLMLLRWLDQSGQLIDASEWSTATTFAETTEMVSEFTEVVAETTEFETESSEAVEETTLEAVPETVENVEESTERVETHAPVPEEESLQYEVPEDESLPYEPAIAQYTGRNRMLAIIRSRMYAAASAVLFLLGTALMLVRLLLLRKAGQAEKIGPEGGMLLSAAVTICLFVLYEVRLQTILYGNDFTTILFLFLPLLLLTTVLLYGISAVLIYIISPERRTHSLSAILAEKRAEKSGKERALILIPLLLFCLYFILLYPAVIYFLFAGYTGRAERLTLEILCLCLAGCAIIAFLAMLNGAKRIQLIREEAVEKARESERFRVDLIANVSHDLRTPLTSILGYGELLQKETLSEEGTAELARLNQKAGYMKELVDSIFELTKVSSGVLKCEKTEIDLIRLLEQTVGFLDDDLSARGLTVKRNYSRETLPILSDGTFLNRVFLNLLANAIKYALPGTRIYLNVTETAEIITVRMTNTASYEMDFDEKEIMERFVRGDQARSTKGSGLGLAIAKTYTEAVGGTFYVKIDGDQFNAVVELKES